MPAPTNRPKMTDAERILSEYRNARILAGFIAARGLPVRPSPKDAEVVAAHRRYVHRLAELLGEPR